MKIIKVDFNDPARAADFITMMSHYASDPMTGGQSLCEQIKADLPAAMAARNDCVSFIAYIDEQPAGLINCIEGFSIFACKPLLNIHDVIVHADYRGRNIAGELLKTAQTEAVARGCAKLTLEVLSGNEPARKVYLREGYAPYVLDPAHGSAEFWQKPLA